MKTGIVLAAAVAGAMLVSAPAAAQREIDERASASPGGVVEIHNVAGSVRVTGWSRNEVQVTGTLGRGAQRLELDSRGGRVTARVVIPPNTRNAGGTELQVRVPAGSSVTVRGVSASVSLAGVNGAVNAQSVSGDVTVSGSPAEVTASSRSGDVLVDVESGSAKLGTTSGDITVRGRVRRSVEANTVSGDVELRATTGEVRVGTVSGDVDVAAMSGRAEVSTVSGDIQLTGRQIAGSFQTVSGEIRVRGDLDRGGTTAFRSHSGNVELHLGSGAEVEVTTFSGEISNEVGARLMRSSSSRREQHLVVGNGGPRVTVRTFSGDVKLSGR